MAKPAVDITLLGDKRLERMFREIPDKAQRTVVRSALRRVAKKVHAETMSRVPVKTGKLKAALAAENKPRLKTFPKAVVYYLNLPRRDLLGIAPDYPWYYPTHVEYGFVRQDGVTVPPHSYIRAAVDENLDVYHGMMRHDINKGIERTLRRLAKAK